MEILHCRTNKKKFQLKSKVTGYKQIKFKCVVNIGEEYLFLDASFECFATLPLISQKQWVIRQWLE